MNERRKSRRFELHLPVTLVRAGGRTLNLSATTQNLSSGGVLFLTDAQLEIGESIEYLVTLPGAAPGIRLRCLGKIVRRAPGAPVADGAPQRRPTAASLERYEFLRD